MSSWRLIFVLPVVFAQPCVAQPTPLGNEARVALVVGVGNYSFERLQNPINDAVDLGAALRRLGFETTVLIDPSRKQIYESLDVLDRSLGRPNSVGLFFFAGHGAQVASRNYLIPIDAIPSSEADVLRLGIDVYEITRRFAAAGSSLNLIVLDACRTVANAPWQKVAAQGLAPVEAPKGTLIAFATAPGGYALDGTGRNGVYTGALLRHIESPGAPIEEVMKRVRNDIATSTRDRQIPWENTSLTRDFYFMPAKTGSSRTRGGPSVDGGDEEKSWLSVRDTSSIYELLTFVERFPKT